MSYDPTTNFLSKGIVYTYPGAEGIFMGAFNVPRVLKHSQNWNNILFHIGTWA